MKSYEVDLFNASGRLSVVIAMACETDTAALCEVIRMGVVDYQRIEVWRDLECVYVGNQLTRHPDP